MADSNARIEQFKKMASDDPNNELGHFSLGRAYLDAGMNAEAVRSFDRVLEINPNITKAYQLLATALLKQEQRETAIERLTRGVQVADARGDLMPKNEMIGMLKELGAPVPALKKSADAAVVAEGQVLCQRCKRVGPKLSSPPFRKAVGQEIQQKICADCWREWIGQGTKVINELRLPLSDPQAQKMYDQHMLEFLNLG